MKLSRRLIMKVPIHLHFQTLLEMFVAGGGAVGGAPEVIVV